MALLFSFDEPGPGDNPGHLNFLDNQERVQEMSPSRKKNWTRKTFLIQPRSHKMILQKKTLSMLPKKLRRSRRRKKGDENYSSTKEERKGYTR